MTLNVFSPPLTPDEHLSHREVSPLQRHTQGILPVVPSGVGVCAGVQQDLNGVCENQRSQLINS